MYFSPTSVKRLAGIAAVCAFLGFFAVLPARAQDQQQQQQQQQQQAQQAGGQMTPEQQAAAQAAFEKGFVHGPAKVPMGDQATLALPQGDMFIPKAQARMILESFGSKPGEGLLGMIVPEESRQENWAVVATYDDSGYVKDDDSSKLDADAILKSLKEGLVQTNARRRKLGIPELEIVGWVEKPHYDHARHQLIWSVEAKDKVQKSEAATDSTGGDSAINYNTFALGRHGYLSLNLITDPQSVARDKTQVAALLTNLTYDKGKAYADFDSTTDKVAEFGLLALITGIAVKKLGLFAIAAAFAAKFAKVLVVAAVGVVASIKKFFMQGRRDETLPPPPPPQA
ncbi:MAG: DUF2167 domain-containing protein [Alphaproteobacteria bacterium]|nr:DUF2167 domain-containing protein [Alphaproteobacteria bacterium]